ncbi:hypothetical protein S23_05890 [Bradyrhizobium cosmicum]|uniref:Uncharacterized protein n=1 Tax=Bradyrhizobium cosmicum TaxID=1404864 RepID=A0AAI8QA08_9BRAD|nr:hypothetical protein S23_05890 [Bradyrhizobium cosmicum]
MVAPHVPSGFVNDRCIALRATWPSAAMIVKGIQRLAMVSMGVRAVGGDVASNLPLAAKQVNHAHVIGAMLAPRAEPHTMPSATTM